MASISQIHSLRLDISDPPDIINIESIALPANLPTSPAPQTAYYIISNARYMRTDKLSGAVSSDYYYCDLFLSDSKINTLINTFGIDIAKYKAIKLILPKLASKLLIVKNTDGATSTEYIRLNDLYKFYKSLIEDFKEETSVGSGRYCSTETPEIAGGNL